MQLHRCHWIAENSYTSSKSEIFKEHWLMELKLLYLWLEFFWGGGAKKVFLVSNDWVWPPGITECQQGEKWYSGQITFYTDKITWNRYSSVTAVTNLIYVLLEKQILYKRRIGRTQSTSHCNSFYPILPAFKLSMQQLLWQHGFSPFLGFSHFSRYIMKWLSAMIKIPAEGPGNHLPSTLYRKQCFEIQKLNLFPAAEAAEFQL